MIKLRTEIEPFVSAQPFRCADSLLVLGSCFADAIGQWLESSGLNVLSNPFGVLYNPASIAQNLQHTLSDISYDCQDKDAFITADKQHTSYYSFDHHSSISAASADALCSKINHLQKQIADFLKQSSHLLITFGTTYVYELASSHRIVANCHKCPASTFVRRDLSIEEIVSAWRQIIRALPEKHFYFTVSPIRYVKDTLHGSQLSKAKLLLSIDMLCKEFPQQVEYLPIYELFMDDLRDYRFYKSDLVHPSDMGVEIAREYFLKSCLTDECQKFMADVKPIMQAIQHRPSNPQSEEYSQFLCQNIIKIETLQKKYAIFTLSKLKHDLESRLK